MAWLLEINDKINIPQKEGENLCCPPHTFPHKPPLTKKITEEPCHTHKAKWRMSRHIIYCKYLKCPHFKRMIEEYKKLKNPTSQKQTHNPQQDAHP